MRLSVGRISLADGVVLLVALLLAMAAVWAGAQRGGAARPAPGTAEEAAGRRVFRREKCFFCHTLDGRPDPATAGAIPFVLGLARSGPDLTREGGKRSDDWHLAHLIAPPAVVAGSTMPAFGHLPDADLRALIAFLQQPVGTPPPAPQPTLTEAIPPVPRTLETYRAGRHLYQQRCQGCHGVAGNGGGPVGHVLNPEPSDFTDAARMGKRSDAYLFAVISDGRPGTAMPGYRQEMDAEQRAMVLRYVRYFSDPVTRQRLEEGLPVEW